MAFAFYGGRYQPAAAGNNTVVTVQTGQTLVLTDLTLASTTTISNYSLYLAGYTIGSGGQIAASQSMTGGTSRKFRGFYVLAAGDAIVYQAATATEAAYAYIYQSGMIGSGTLPDGGTPMRWLANTGNTTRTVAYTVPAGRTLVIKTIVISNPLSAANAGSVLTSDFPIIGYLEPVNGYATVQFDGSWVLGAGQTLQTQQGAAATLSFSIFGVLY